MNAKLARMLGFSIVIILLVTGLPMFVNKEAEVSANEAPAADAGGYTWIDSRAQNPRINYDWIDISTIGTNLVTKFPYQYTSGVYYYYPIPDYEPLGFSFPFYGASYDKIQIHPNGILAFGPSTYGYAYYNYQGPLPNQYVYTPQGTISAFWVCYGGGVKALYVYKGVTSENVKYWVCTWKNLDYGYALGYLGSQGSTVQCILYETGEIRVNVQVCYLYYSYYLTTGICNYDRTVGITYWWASSGGGYGPWTAGQSILFKQYATSIDPPTFTEGYGVDKDIYPAMASEGPFDYSAKVQLYSEKGVQYLNTFDYRIGPDWGADAIILRYDFTTSTFRKLGDPLRLVNLNTTTSSVVQNSTDPEHYVWVEFRYDFNMHWPKLDMVNVDFTLQGRGVRGSYMKIENRYRVVATVRMLGNLTVQDGRGTSLVKGDWVRGGDSLHFFGMKRHYSDDAIPLSLQPPDMIKIGIKDAQGTIYLSPDTSDLDLYIYVDPVFSEMEYRLIFVNVTGENDKTDSLIQALYDNGYLFRIDHDSPGLASSLEILPDEKTDQPRNYDNDREVYLKWEDALDASSGVVLYHISQNKRKSENPSTITVQKGTNIAYIPNLQEGENRIYIWAEDFVGNTGNDVFITVKIDLSRVSFSDFYPASGVWINTIYPTCSIYINDSLTGVDPLSIEYEISTNKEAGLVGQWQPIQDAYAPGNALRVVVKGLFRNGKDNYIRFQAKDMAGNGPEPSQAYNIWIDAESPRFKALYSQDDYHINPFQEVKLQIDDPQSGVDSTSIEYRITTKGQTKWTPWKPYKDADDGRTVVVIIRELFRRGDQNFVQVRAKDLAGNPISTSPAYNIKINTYPELVISSPNPGDVYTDKDVILFDASDSYDPDGDSPLFITWHYSAGVTQETLGDSFEVSATLKPGEYTVTVILKDKVNNEVQQFFTITVNEYIPPTPENPDTDGDEMPNWYEIKFKLKVLEKDADEDPDIDGFTNLEEFKANTNPQEPGSHPVIAQDVKEEEDRGPFGPQMWPLWALLVVLVVAILLTVAIAKAKKDRAIKRIKTIKNMRRIMPSVSWDQITATAYIAPMTQGASLPPPMAQMGQALPSPAAEVPADKALPPAPAEVVQAAPAQVPAEPAPAPQPAYQTPPAGTIPVQSQQ